MAAGWQEGAKERGREAQYGVAVSGVWVEYGVGWVLVDVVSAVVDSVPGGFGLYEGSDLWYQAWGYQSKVAALVHLLVAEAVLAPAEQRDQGVGELRGLPV